LFLVLFQIPARPTVLLPSFRFYSFLQYSFLSGLSTVLDPFDFTNVKDLSCTPRSFQRDSLKWINLVPARWGRKRSSSMP
jgi:hypothetical protein